MGYAPLSVEALALSASFSTAQGEADKADKDLSQALWTSVAIGHDTVALEALTERIFVRARFLAMPSQALADADLAKALVQRTTADPQAVGLLWNNLGVAYEMTASFEQAERSLQEAITALDGESSPYINVARNNLGGLYLTLARYEDAVEVLSALVEKTSAELGKGHPHTIVARFNLAMAHHGSGHTQEALSILDKALADVDATFPAGSEYRLSSRLYKALIQVETRDYAEAAEAIDSVMSDDSRARNPLTAAIFDQWKASALAGVGELQASLDLHRQSISALAESKDEAPPTYADALDAYGDTLRRAGLLQDSESKLRESLALREEKLPPNTPSLAITLEKLAQTYIALERYEDAEASLTRAQAIVDEKLPPTSQLKATLERTTAELELARDNPSAAVEHARAALSIHEATRDADDGELALTRFALARALRAETKGSAEAKTLAAEALTALREGGEGWAPEAEQVDTWIQRL